MKNHKIIKKKLLVYLVNLLSSHYD